MPPFVVGANRVSTWREIMTALAGIVLVLFALIYERVNSTVVLITYTNESMSFPDTEAIFAPRIPGPGLLGLLYASSPPDACQELRNSPPSLKFPFFPFVVVARGQCTFETKVHHAQAAGFAAVIVYNNEENEDLITMSGNPTGIKISAVFVSKSAGDFLLKYSRDISTTCYILPSFESTTWSVLVVSFISLLAVTVVLATFFFVRRHRLRHLGSRLQLNRESLSMSSREVKALPSFVFTCVGDRNATSETCAICLEDYDTGEKLRILPCRHEFHAICIDKWLTTRRPFCPICKRNPRSKMKDAPPSANTPLLNTVSSAPIPMEPQSSATIEVSPPNSLHTHSIGSFDWSYVSSAVGSPIEVYTHVASLEDTLQDSPVESLVNEHYSSSFDVDMLPAGASMFGQCSEQSIHSSIAHLHGSPEKMLYHSPQSRIFSQANQNCLGRRSASYSSSDALHSWPSTGASSSRTPQQCFTAGSLCSFPNVFHGSQSDLPMLENLGMDQC